jgi:YD repeat-containing protein
MRLALLALLLASAHAAASPTAETYNCGYQVVTVGDSVGKLRQACGEPSRVVALQFREGGSAGTRYEYDRNGRTVMFTVTGGRITRIERI